jgi:tetratricopeptide (TPR) repeat protein
VVKGVKIAIDKAFKEDTNGSLSDVKNKVYSDCYLMFARAFFNKGDFKESRKNFKKAIKMYPKNFFRFNSLFLFPLSFSGPKVIKKVRELKHFIIR